jgi:hypothetical protein
VTCSASILDFDATKFVSCCSRRARASTSGGGEALGTDGSEVFGSMQESEIVAKRSDLRRFSDQLGSKISLDQAG